MVAFTGCSSPLSFHAPTRDIVAEGLAVVEVVGHAFLVNGTTRTVVPSQTPVTLQITLVNPRSQTMTYHLATNLDASLFLTMPPEAPTPVTPMNLAIPLTLGLAAEHKTLVLTLTKTSSVPGKEYATDTFAVVCDTEPNAVQNATLARDDDNRMLLAFTLPVEATDDDLASAVVTYQDVTTSPPGPVVTVTRGVDASEWEATPTTDPLSAVTSTVKRYFRPTVVTGHGYAFTVTLTDALGQRSGTVTLGGEGIHYTLTYQAPNATAVPAATTYDYGTNATVGTATRTGYTLSGWNSKADGTGTTYHPQDTILMNQGDLTLYAQWTLNTYTLQFDAQGGTGSMAATTATYQESVTLPPLGFTKAGAQFVGWSLTAGGPVVYTDGASVSMPAGDLTLYALWQAGLGVTIHWTTASGAVTAGSNVTVALGAVQSFTVSTSGTTTWYLDGAPVGTGATYTYAPTLGADVGAHSVVVTVLNAQGQFSSATVGVTVTRGDSL
jgi:uncharacterized repeat protein (TIGR02543 family)